MADTITPERRSEIMSHIKSKNTSIELMVRRYLFALGYRYRVNYKALPGKPDIVFTKKKIAIFIHGCYWHGHDCGSRYAHSSKSNKAYWGPKIQRTQQRDQDHIATLEANGWKVIVLWECWLKTDCVRIMEKLIEDIEKNT
jgi:DNA mismatch endonuclease (patch repair protein)